MKKLLLLFCLLLVAQTGYSQAEATLTGTVTSLDGSALPKAHVTISPWANNSDLFNTETVEVKPDGSFQTAITKSGIYRLTIQGVLHKSIVSPLWIRKPDTLEFSIRLDPKNMDDGKYFKNDEYLSWIRVTGNFNGYNYDQGVIFKRVEPKTLKATIKTSLDTIRYQIVGITSGTSVLPGAADYRLRDARNYEAVVPVKNNTVELTYRADSTYYPNKNPYEGYRTTWDPNQSELKFSGSFEDEIHKNLDIRNILPNIFNYKIFESDSLPVERFQMYMEEVDRKIVQINIHEMSKIEDQISNYKNSTTVNEYYLQSLYIRYLLLSENLLRINQMVNESAEPDKKLKGKIETNILEASMLHIPPSSQLWSLRNSLITLLPEILGYTDSVISYLERVVSGNPDNSITGSLLLELFKWSYDTNGKSERTQEYYQNILDSFGNNYYARKAREHIQKND